MFHITAGIFGSGEAATALAKRLGKAGTANDIAIYNHGSSEGLFTYITVNSDKIQSLMQAINMIDVPVIAISELNAALGEQLIAISEFGFEKGFLVLENVSHDQILSLIKGTCIEKFSVVNGEQLVEELKKVHIERKPAPLVVPIDNYFNVKSVGTVILGVVRSGVVHKYDKVVVEPLGREVMVKGIQSQDKDIDVAEAGTRVGLNLKGIEAEELKRGYVVGVIMKSNTLRLAFEKSKYFRDTLKEGDQIFLSSGLQVATVRVKSISPLEIESELPIVFEKNTKFLLATTKQTAPRIIGKASLL